VFKWSVTLVLEEIRMQIIWFNLIRKWIIDARHQFPCGPLVWIHQRLGSWSLGIVRASVRSRPDLEPLQKNRYIIPHLILNKFVGLCLLCLSMPFKSKSSMELNWILQSHFRRIDILSHIQFSTNLLVVCFAQACRLSRKVLRNWNVFCTVVKYFST